VSFYNKHIAFLINRTLIELDLYSVAASQLLLGTLAIESLFGKYLRQRSKYEFDINKHGLGIFQIEKNTFNWLKRKYLHRFPIIAGMSFEQLEYDLRASIIFARLRYLVVREPLPAANDIKSMAEYWKKYYNASVYGMSVRDFINRYNSYVKQTL